MNTRCLIVDDMHPSIIPLLESAGITPEYRPDITKEEVKSIIGDYIGIIVRSKLKIDGALLDQANQLKFIARAGAGLDNIDVKEVEKRKILLVNASEGNRDAVGEHTIGMILTLLNKIHIADSEVKNKIWDREGNRGYEIKGKCVAIIGYGFMGKSVAQKLSAFGCKVIAFDKYLHHYSDKFVEEVDIQRVFDEADIVTFHIPLTDETRKMVNTNFLHSFKKNIWLINTARGEIISLTDLVKAIEEGKLKGVALDVLENEKLETLSKEQQAAFQYLAGSDKVLLTPHIAGWTFESYERINIVLVEKIKVLSLF